MAEWGIKKGLAQDFSYDQRTSDLARQNHEMRQAQIYKEAKTKMMAGDFDYNNAMNAWDNQAVKSFAQTKLKELGQFMRENPDWQTNLDKRIVYNNLTKELKDNKALNEGLQVDGNIKAMQAYMNDPKNAPVVQSEDFAPIMQSYKNYLKTGSTDGVTGNRQLFTFMPPEELVDTTPILIKYAQSVGQNGKQQIGLARGAGSIKQFTTDQDKSLAADSAINDRQLGRYLKQEYAKYTENLAEGEKPMNLKQFTVAKMNPYFKGPEYKNYSYSVKEPGAGGAGKQGTTMNFYDELKQRAIEAKRNGFGPIAAGASGINEVLTGGKDHLNTQGLKFETADGSLIDVKPLITKNFTTAGSKAIYTDNGLRGSVTVQLPLEQAMDFFEASDAIEDPWFGGPTVSEAYKNKIQLSKDDSGNDVAIFELWAPLEGTNVNTAGAYNHGMHTKAEEANSQSFEPTPVSQKTSNGVTYTQYSNGSITGSDGSVYDSLGNKIK